MTDATNHPDNFGFLGDYDEQLRRLGRQAESYVHSDPDSCLFKLRLMVETMAKRLLEMQRPDLVSSDLGTMLRALEQANLVSRRQADALHAVRRDGNAAVHGETTSPPTAMRRLSTVHRLSNWYAKMIRRGSKPPQDKFVPPTIPAKFNARARAALKEAETLENEIETRRERTRDALLLYGNDCEVDQVVTSLRLELEALDRVASAAGEPLIDADSVMLIMAMELESLLEHPRLGLTSREARREAERQFDFVRHQLDEREQEYASERARIARTIQTDLQDAE